MTYRHVFVNRFSAFETHEIGALYNAFEAFAVAYGYGVFAVCVLFDLAHLAVAHGVYEMLARYAYYPLGIGNSLAVNRQIKRKIGVNALVFGLPRSAENAFEHRVHSAVFPENVGQNYCYHK